MDVNSDRNYIKLCVVRDMTWKVACRWSDSGIMGREAGNAFQKTTLGKTREGMRQRITEPQQEL